MAIPSSAAKCSAASVGPNRSSSEPEYFCRSKTQHPAPKFRGFATIGNSTHIAMLQPFAALLLIASPQAFDLAVTQLQHCCGIDQLQFLFSDSSHHFHSLQLTGAHSRPLQQNLPWLEVSV